MLPAGLAVPFMKLAPELLLLQPASCIGLGRLDRLAVQSRAVGVDGVAHHAAKLAGAFGAHPAGVMACWPAAQLCCSGQPCGVRVEWGEILGLVAIEHYSCRCWFQVRCAGAVCGTVVGCSSTWCRSTHCAPSGDCMPSSAYRRP